MANGPPTRKQLRALGTSSQEAWQATLGRHPHTSLPLGSPLHGRSRRGSRKAPPPSPVQEQGGCKWEVARSRRRGKPAQVTEAGGGDTVREGVHRAAGEREPLGSSETRSGPEKMKEHLLQVEAGTSLPPTPGGRVTLRKLLWKTGGRA